MMVHWETQYVHGYTNFLPPVRTPTKLCVFIQLALLGHIDLGGGHKHDTMIIFVSLDTLK